MIVIIRRTCSKKDQPEHRTVVRHVLWKGVYKASTPNHGHLIPYRTPCCPAIVLALIGSAIRKQPRILHANLSKTLPRPQAEKVEEVAILSTCGLRAVKVNYYDFFSSLSPPFLCEVNHLRRTLENKHKQAASSLSFVS